MSASKPSIYPQQAGPYSVKVKNGAAWRAYNTCRLQISVGQTYHEGDKFEATVNWAKNRFDRVIICVNDTLQRYNSLYKEDISEKEAEQKWAAEGDKWIQRNRHALDLLPDCRIYKWNDWKSQPQFKLSKDTVEVFYQTNKIFSDAIQKNIDEFWSRQFEHLTNQVSYEHFASCSRKYLLEETAVFSIMFQQDNAVDVYPGSVLLPAILFRGNPVAGMPQGLDKGAFTRIDFKRNYVSDYHPESQSNFMAA